MKPTIKKRLAAAIAAALLFAAVLTIAWANIAVSQLAENYAAAESNTIAARDGSVLFLRPNPQGYYVQYANRIPEHLKNLLIAKEDKTFYWHAGINPVAVARGLAARIGIGGRRGSSTITQQLAKILMGNTNNRTIGNKLAESAAAIALELSQTKDQIIGEYANSIFFGNRLQGITAASRAYFGVAPDKLNEAQILQLLAAISDPNGTNPAKDANIAQAEILAKMLGVNVKESFTPSAAAKENLAAYFTQNATVFELAGYLELSQCLGSQVTWLDQTINEKIRRVVAANLEELGTKKAKNAAAVVIGFPQNQVLSLIGSPDPSSDRDGYRINMLNVPRQIGSTIKPFIYLKAFQKGMRPYTLIDDREYKYAAGLGHSIYPENYDRVYHGVMTAHYALANSINVAAVLTLNFTGNRDFGDFVQNELEIPVAQNYENYQMGVALGAMETDIINLARAFTIFPNNGKLRDLELFSDPLCNESFSPQKDFMAANPPYIQMINKILSDRKIAQDQFSTASDLNLPANNYALKTGTSHDYTDSWVIGYTPDFLVAVWVGNADASAMEGLSGQLGAGKIWNDIMEIMLASDYNKKTPLDFSGIAAYSDGTNIQYGLADDNYEMARNILLAADTALIQKPHAGDTYQLENFTRIILRSARPAIWHANGRNLGEGTEIIWVPSAPGSYIISASDGSKSESVEVHIIKK